MGIKYDIIFSNSQIVKWTLYFLNILRTYLYVFISCFAAFEH